MKLLLENWREFMNEDEKAPLGNIAFANNTIDPSAPEEPDTPTEEQLVKALHNHFLRDQPLPTGYAITLVNMINKGQYPETLQRYNKGDVYRGFAIPRDIFEEKFGPLPEKPKWFRAPLDAMMMRAEKSFQPDEKGSTYTPHQRKRRKPKGKTQAALFPDLEKIAVSSWTTKKGQTDHFRQQVDPGDVSIVLVADSSEQQNYFIDSEPLYDYDFAHEMRSEAEVIGVGDIKIKDLIWHFGG